MLRIKQPSKNELNKLLHVTNTVVQKYGQPPLYAAPRTATFPSKSGRNRRPSKISTHESDPVQDCSQAFHFSIAWTLKEPTSDMRLATTKITAKFNSVLEGISISVGEVKNKVGNVVHNLKLNNREIEGASLFGL